MEICVQNTVDTLITSKNGYPAEQLHSRNNNATDALDTRIRVSCVEWIILNTEYSTSVHWLIILFFYHYYYY